jgi:hypothetical protein
VWRLANELTRLRGEEKSRLDLPVRISEFELSFRGVCRACGFGLGVHRNVWRVLGRAGAMASENDDFGEIKFFVRVSGSKWDAGVLLLLLGKGASFEDEFAEPRGVWERLGKLGIGWGWVLGADGVGGLRSGIRWVGVCGCRRALGSG